MFISKLLNLILCTTLGCGALSTPFTEKNEENVITFIANSETMGDGKDPTSMDYFQGTQYPHLSLVIPYLNEKNIRCEVLSWTDKTIDWAKKKKIVLGPVWGYTKNIDEFTSWLSTIEKSNTKTLNDTKFIIWNIKKTYLNDLKKEEIEIPDTLIIEPESTLNFDEAISIFTQKFNSSDIIIKGVIDAGGFEYLHITPDKLEVARKHFQKLKSNNHGVVMQKFIPEIYKKGEFSFVIFKGKISHYYLKVPKENQERVQPFYGGKSFHFEKNSAKKMINEIQANFRSDLELNEEEAKIAYTKAEETYAKLKILLKKINIPCPEYLRIDGVLSDSHFLVMELEGIEPYLEMREAIKNNPKNNVLENYFQILIDEDPPKKYAE